MLEFLPTTNPLNIEAPFFQASYHQKDLYILDFELLVPSLYVFVKLSKLVGTQ